MDNKKVATIAVAGTPGFITEPGVMTLIKIFGDIRVFNESVEFEHLLQPGEAYVAVPSMDELALRPFGHLELPNDLYDFDKDFRDQILFTLHSVEAKNNVGVLLEGVKGMGKSVTAKLLAMESKLPVIIIDAKIHKDINIAQSLNKIKQDYVLFIDEFEKLFDETDNKDNPFHPQDSFLSYLDGVSNSNHKRLVILTTNKEINDKFIDRPSRIRYHRKYNYMPEPVWRAILDDKLEDKSLETDLLENLDIQMCTIDTLTTIIEEINLHKKPYSKFKEFFNHHDKEHTYSKYIKTSEGEWRYQEDIITKKEIGFDDNRFYSAVGHQQKMRIISNDGDIIIYEHQTWIKTPRKPMPVNATEEQVADWIDETEDHGKYVMNTYKLKKFNGLKPSMGGGRVSETLTV